MQAKEELLFFHNKWKNSHNLISFPFYETIHNCVCLLELLPKDAEFIKICINLFVIALPMLYNLKVTLESLKKMAKLVFSKVSSKIARSWRKVKA